MTLKIDQEECIGCSSCSVICGEVFEMRDDGKAHIKEKANKKAKLIKEAIASCQTNAISE